VQLAQAGADGDGLADVAHRDAVAVALEGDHGGARDDSLDRQLCGERRGRKREQWLPGGEFGDRPAGPPTTIGHRDGPAVQIGLGLAQRGDRRGAPPRARDVLDRRLDDALALRAARRADPHLDAEMLGDLRELGGHPIAAGMDDGRHAIGPPRPSGAAQAAQDAVERVDEVREGHPLADHRAQAAREGQRADEDVGGLAPRRLGELQPVPLDLLAGLVDQLHGRAVPAGAARLAARAQPLSAQRAHERHIRTLESELGDLAKQHGPVDVRVVGQARDQVVAERLQTTRRRLADRPVNGEVLAHRLAIPTGVPSDRRDRPAPASERADLHIVLLSQHPPGGLLYGQRRRTPRPWRGHPTDPRRRLLAPLGPPRHRSASRRRYEINGGEFP
jgi:hypothetical protein